LNPRRLVLFVEGKGDTAAIPALARRVLKSSGADDALFVDAAPFVVKGVGTLVKNDYRDWHRWLSAAVQTRRNIGAVLLVLDGDPDRVPKSWASYRARYNSTDFCPVQAATILADAARSSRAGEAFSLAVVFAMREFEAWLVAGVHSLRNETLLEGRGRVPADASAPAPEIDIEAKRDAKGELRKLIPGYDQTLDQGVLAAKVDMAAVAQRCRSFRRFQSAIQQLAVAARKGEAIVSPITQ
jgi:hypothetical protein